MIRNAGQGKCPFHAVDHIEDLDMLDEEMRRNPWPFYDWLRLEPDRRVYKLSDESIFYVLHRHEDVKATFLNTEQLSSKIIPTVESLFVALMDGEEHRRVRTALSTMFLPMHIDALEGAIKEIARKHTDDACSKKEFDLLSSWAIPIPMKVLATLLDLPTDDAFARQLYDEALAINRAIFVTGGTGPRRKDKPSALEKFRITLSLIKNVPKMVQLAKLIGISGLKELARKLSVTDEKLDVPRPNFQFIPHAVGPFLNLLILMGKQLGIENKSDRLETLKTSIQDGNCSQLEMMLATAFILFAGHETSISLLSNSVVHLAKNPILFNELKKNPDKIDGFIEECLRYYTPVGRFLRRVIAPLQIGDSVIPTNAIIILMSGAANTDSAKFENGCEFNINRKNGAQHLSFGKGQHFCIGAQLARNMTKIALSQLIKSVLSITIDESKPSSFVTDRDNGVYRYEVVGIKVS